MTGVQTCALPIWPGADGQVQAALVTLLQRNLLGIACGNALIATLTAVGLAGAVATLPLLGWLLLQWLHSAFSAWAWWKVRRRPASARSAPYRLRAARMSSLASGLLWALALPLLWPPDRLELQLLMICMLIGMTAGAVHSLTADLRAFNNFLVPNVLAVSAMSLWQGGTLHGVIAAASLVYGLTSMRFAASVHAAQRNALRQHDVLSALAVDLRAQKDRADEASLAKSRFLAAASHDLRQPVHALSLFLGALTARPLDDESRRLVRHAGRTVDAMSKLFNALLDVSRLDAGMVQPDWRTVPLAPLLARIAEEEGAVARAKGLRFTLRLPPNAEVLSTRSDALLLDCGDLRDLSAKHTGVLLPILRWNDDPAAAAGRPRGVSLGGSCVLRKEVRTVLLIPVGHAAGARLFLAARRAAPHGLTLLQEALHSFGRHALLIVHHRFLDRVADGPGNLGMAQTRRLLGQVVDGFRGLQVVGQAHAQQRLDILRGRHVVLHHVVEAPEQRFVQDVRVIRRRDDHAAGVVLLDHQQEAVEDAADLANVVGHAALAADRVELVEEIHPAS